jgi:hypothetical protein
MRKSLLSTVILLCLTTSHIWAQELNAKVRVMHDKIQNVDVQVFKTMEQSILSFMNTRKWTKDEFAATEKIDVNILINLTGREPSNDVYTGTINIQSSRPVYNASYTSPTVNYIDRDVVFRYSQFTPLQFDDNRVAGNNPVEANLTAILAYYTYIILGLDYDSFAPLGGTELFKKAQNVVNNAPEEGKALSGWKAVEGNRNRYWIIDQILSPRFSEVRNYWYTMHRKGFDNMYAKPSEARQEVLAGLTKMSQVQRENPGSILLQFFFNAKSDEIIKVVSGIPKEQRTQYVTMLSSMDVVNAAKYQALLR